MRKRFQFSQRRHGINGCITIDFDRTFDPAKRVTHECFAEAADEVLRDLALDIKSGDDLAQLSTWELEGLKAQISRAMESVTQAGDSERIGVLATRQKVVMAMDASRRKKAGVADAVRPSQTRKLPATGIRRVK